MSSSTIRGIRRKKSSLGELKVAVVGAPGVGKSALTVRFLTKRYIGEYGSINENRYRHETMVDGEPVIFEILDTSNFSRELILQMDGFLLVYSITDRSSFQYVKKVKQQLSEYKNGEMNTLSVGPSNNNVHLALRESGNTSPSPLPTVLVANKSDMVHLRQISTEEGEILAKDLDCSFAEVAASEQVTQVAEVFHEVCREVQAAKRKTKQSLLDRVLGNKAAAGLRVYARGKSDSALPKE